MRTRQLLPGDRTLESILAMRGRRHGDLVELLAPLQKKLQNAQTEVIDELRWKGRGMVLARNPAQAQEMTQRRQGRTAALQTRAQELAGELEGQDAGQKMRGRELSDSGAKARLFHEVCEAHPANTVRVDPKMDLFICDIDQTAQARDEAMDGKLLLVTKVADMDANRSWRATRAWPTSRAASTC